VLNLQQKRYLSGLFGRLWARGRPSLIERGLAAGCHLIAGVGDLSGAGRPNDADVAVMATTVASRAGA
jgi:hypothetical protein